MLEQLQKIKEIDHECVKLIRIVKEMGISIEDIRKFLETAHVSEKTKF